MFGIAYLDQQDSRLTDAFVSVYVVAVQTPFFGCLIEDKYMYIYIYMNFKYIHTYVFLFVHHNV